MKHTTFLAATATAAFFAVGASAATVDIELIESVFENAVGGTNVVYNPEGPDLDPGVVTVTWGVPSNFSQQNPNLLKSGYAFAPSSTPFPASPGEAFVLGDFTHNNWAIRSGGGITSVDLTFLFGGSPDGTPDAFRPAVTFPATFRFLHTETPNVAGTCPEGSVTICDDLVMVTALGGASEQVRVGNLVYTFTLLGFGSNPAAADFSDVFQTAEAGTNTTQLWAVYTVAPIPLPAAGWLLLGGLGALGVAARRRRNTA